MTSFADWLDRGSTAAGGLVRVVRDGQIAIVTLSDPERRNWAPRLTAFHRDVGQQRRGDPGRRTDVTAQRIDHGASTEPVIA